MKKSLVTLTLAGLLWGLTVPLSKLALEWLDGGWLTVVRFGIAAPILAVLARKHLRAAFTPAILLAGAAGYGVVIVLQNAGIGHTSVSHAALIVGAVPALVALIATATGRSSTGPVAWLGFGLALGGVALVAGGGGGGATLTGDGLVLLSVSLSGVFVVTQPGLRRGRRAGPPSRTRPDGGDRGADALGHGRRNPQRGVRGPAVRAVVGYAGDRPRGAGHARHPGAVRAVRLRAVARPRRACGRVPELGAARRHRCRRARIRGSLRQPAVARRSGDPDRHRPEH